MMMAAAYIASERRHAHSAINTIQADRRSVVIAMHTRYEHLEEMGQTMLDDRYSTVSHISDMLSHPRPSATIQAQRSVVDEECASGGHLVEMRPTMIVSIVMSHVSDMHERRSPYSTTLRGFAVCMVLHAPVGTSHVSDMMELIPPSETLSTVPPHCVWC